MDELLARRTHRRDVLLATVELLAEGDQLRLRLLEDALAFRDLAFAVLERSFARRNLLFTRHELPLERRLLLLEVRSERRGSGLGALELLLPF